MEEIIKVEAATTELIENLTFSIQKGSIVVILTPKEEYNPELVRLITGFIRPETGFVTVLGRNIVEIPDDELMYLRQRIGVVYANGGLVSNLKAWENVSLPMYYHTKLNHQDIEEKGLRALKRVGYAGKLMALPGLLSPHQKKLLGFARTMLIDPDLIIYESPLMGLNHNEKSSFLQTAQDFHQEKPDRTSLFITSSSQTIQLLTNTTVITL